MLVKDTWWTRAPKLVGQTARLRKVGARRVTSGPYFVYQEPWNMLTATMMMEIVGHSARIPAVWPKRKPVAGVLSLEVGMLRVVPDGNLFCG